MYLKYVGMDFTTKSYFSRDCIFTDYFLHRNAMS